MKTTNKSIVELIDNMGTDLTIVNAARVSFDKESDWEYINETSVGQDDVITQCLSNDDEKLINYLAKHNHWSPFAHTSIQLRVNAPIFVARQLVKHQVGGVWNEVSRRYVAPDLEKYPNPDDDPASPEFYFPDNWRKRAKNVKQGSSEESVYCEDRFFKNLSINDKLRVVLPDVLQLYTDMLEAGLAPEQARMILPQNMMTSWYWTGSLMFFHRVYKQRTGTTAQLESQEVAKQIGEICQNLFPIAWKALAK